MISKFNILFIALTALTLFLNSCGTYIYKDHLNLEKGISLEKFNNLGISFVNQINLRNNEILGKDNYIVFIQLRQSVYKNQYYLYAFKDNILIFWGYPYTFTRHNDPVIQAIGEECSDYILNNEYLY
jgi:hypothetical protein